MCVTHKHGQQWNDDLHNWPPKSKSHSSKSLSKFTISKKDHHMLIVATQKLLLWLQDGVIKSRDWQNIELDFVKKSVAIFSFLF